MFDHQTGNYLDKSMIVHTLKRLVKVERFLLKVSVIMLLLSYWLLSVGGYLANGFFFKFWVTRCRTFGSIGNTYSSLVFSSYVLEFIGELWIPV